MSDDTYYITTHEAALAVVATAMKKSRLRLDSLMLTSLLGGILFSCGGMLHFLVQAGFREEFKYNPAVVHLFQGAVYPIGLFFVVTMGTDLYNSNILFFTVGLLRGAVSVLDLLISWIVSFFFNLLGSLFVAYVMCYVSKSTTDADFILLSEEFLETKLSFSFAENLVKGIPCNFLVSLLIYLQLMAKPHHVKFMMLFFPVFTFVSMGFNHVVADMFIIPLALLNTSKWSVGEYIWKSMIPSLIGNIIGGAAFGISFPWYLHLIVVEMDKKKLNLPEYDARDEQPEQGMDSRVVRVSSGVNSALSSRTLDEDDEESGEKLNPEDFQPVSYNPIIPVRSRQSVRSLSGLSRHRTNSSSLRLRPSRTRNSAEFIRSPKGVFPVYGMGEPYPSELKLADRFSVSGSDHLQQTPDNSMSQGDEFLHNNYDPTKSTLSGNLKRAITRSQRPSALTVVRDIESHPNGGSPTAAAQTKPTFMKSSFSLGSSATNNDYYNISKAASRAGLTRNSILMSEDVAGIHPRSINLEHHRSEDANALRKLQSRASAVDPLQKRVLSEQQVPEEGPSGSPAPSADIHDEVESVDSGNQYTDAQNDNNPHTKQN